MNRIYTCVELSSFGFTGRICKNVSHHLTQSRYLTVVGSRRTVRRALKAELRRCGQVGPAAKVLVHA